MPAIVIGADTEIGLAIIAALAAPDRDVRAFVSDPTAGVALKQMGAKVATGDVSDSSHLAAACHGCFTAVLCGDAAEDDRVRDFADDRDEVTRAWAQAIAAAGVQRAIWVSAFEPPPQSTKEFAHVLPSGPFANLAKTVQELDTAGTI